MTELDATLINSMTKHLEQASPQFAFVQARVSAEALVRDVCALAIHDAIDKQAYHVHMEKLVDGKKVDLLICQASDEQDDKANACLIELKMAWPGGLGECSGYVRHDLNALSGRSNAWSLVLYFAFRRSLAWMPFNHCAMDFDGAVQQFIEKVGAGEPLRGSTFQFKHDGVEGTAQLLAWHSRTPI